MIKSHKAETCCVEPDFSEGKLHYPLFVTEALASTDGSSAVYYFSLDKSLHPVRFMRV